jgi:hypothetical protein
VDASDILKYGHRTVLATVDGLPEAEWYTPNVCGVWSVKDILAHLASFEHMLVDVLNSLLCGTPTPALDRYRAGLAFNDDEVASRQDKGVHEVFAEYRDTHAEAARLLEQVPVEMRRLKGSLPWYGEAYDLEDFLVYTFYGHKREHCAQINVFKDSLTRQAAFGQQSMESVVI